MILGRRLLLIFILTFCGFFVYAQHYSAIHGSNYSGSLGVYNNPSSIVHTPFKWDLTLFGTQYQIISNALNGRNFPLYLLPSTKFRVADGNFVRHADVISNLRLLNGRYAINKKNVIAFGANMKTYTQARTSTFNYNDSVLGVRSFLYQNENNRELSVNAISSAWLELYGTYGLTLWDRSDSRLNVGITGKLQKGMSGVFARMSGIEVETEIQDNTIVNNIKGGAARYGISQTHGDISSFDLPEAFRLSQGGASIDIGVEYIVKTQAVTTIFDDDSYYDYEWKIGLSLLDLGLNRFVYNHQSRDASSLQQNVSGEILHQKFNRINGLNAFNDSLSTIVNNYSALSGPYNIYNPVRAVINVDRYMWNNFYVNAELSVNLLKHTDKRMTVVDSRLITVTPRWEGRKFGFYLPAQVTRHGNFWVGGAIKAGPLLLGTHNLLNIFSSWAKINGGGYLAITLRPSDFIRDPADKRLSCPSL